MNVELISITPNAEQVIEMAGRTCYKSPEGDLSIIRNWIRKGHESVIEHASASFRISGVSRALTHQLVRHRLASFSQQSQRYVSEVDFGYVTPDSIKDKGLEMAYQALMRDIQSFYNAAVQAGVKKEDARFVLPNATTTEIVITANMREWRRIFSLRCDSHSQWEIRKAMNYCLMILKNECPNVFFDFEV